MDIRIKWEAPPEGNEPVNRDRMILHTDYEFPTVGPQQQFAEMLGREINDQAKAFSELMNGIHGVGTFVCAGYMLLIDKGSVFGWDEVQPRIEQAVMEFAGADNIINSTVEA